MSVLLELTTNELASVKGGYNKETQTIEKGDTYWGIAKEMYGDGNRWRELPMIRGNNGGTDPKKLKVGSRVSSVQDD